MQMTVLADHIAALQTRGRDTGVAMELLELPISRDTHRAANLYIIALDEIVRLQDEHNKILKQLAKARLSDIESAAVANMTLRQWHMFVKDIT